MILKNVFNIILLSLIFTTLLITIVSYIVFRIRQLTGKRQTEELHHLTGTYFNRYAPHLDLLNKEHILKSNTSINETQNAFKIKLAVVFIIIFSIVTLSFLLENQIRFRNELLSKSNQADTYRQLIQEGLLKKFTYNPSYEPTFDPNDDSLNISNTDDNLEQEPVHQQEEPSNRITLNVVLDNSEQNHDFILDTFNNYVSNTTFISTTNSFPSDFENKIFPIAIFGDKLASNLFTTKNLFEKLETIRFDLEFFSKKEVSGLWLYETSLNSKLLNAAVQNEIKYITILSENNSAVSKPIFAGNKTWILNYAIINDNDILLQKDLTSVEQALNLFMKMINDTQQQANIVRILFHEKNYTQKFNQKVLQELLQKLKTNYKITTETSIIPSLETKMTTELNH